MKAEIDADWNRDAGRFDEPYIEIDSRLISIIENDPWSANEGDKKRFPAFCYRLVLKNGERLITARTGVKIIGDDYLGQRIPIHDALDEAQPLTVELSAAREFSVDLEAVQERGRYYYDFDAAGNNAELIKRYCSDISWDTAGEPARVSFSFEIRDEGEYRGRSEESSWWYREPWLKDFNSGGVKLETEVISPNADCSAVKYRHTVSGISYEGAWDSDHFICVSREIGRCGHKGCDKSNQSYMAWFPSEVRDGKIQFEGPFTWDRDEHPDLSTWNPEDAYSIRWRISGVYSRADLELASGIYSWMWKDGGTPEDAFCREKASYSVSADFSHVASCDTGRPLKCRPGYTGTFSQDDYTCPDGYTWAVDSDGRQVPAMYISGILMTCTCTEPEYENKTSLPTSIRITDAKPADPLEGSTYTLQVDGYSEGTEYCTAFEFSQGGASKFTDVGYVIPKPGASSYTTDFRFPEEVYAGINAAEPFELCWLVGAPDAAPAGAIAQFQGTLGRIPGTGTSTQPSDGSAPRCGASWADGLKEGEGYLRTCRTITPQTPDPVDPDPVDPDPVDPDPVDPDPVDPDPVDPTPVNPDPQAGGAPESVKIVALESDSGTLATDESWKKSADMPAEVDDCKESSCDREARMSYCRRVEVELMDGSDTIVQDVLEAKGSGKIGANNSSKEHWFEGLLSDIKRELPYRITYSVGALHNVDEKGATFCKDTLATWLPDAATTTRYAYRGNLYESIVQLRESAQQATMPDAKSDFERLYGGTDYRFLSESASRVATHLARDSSVTDNVFASEQMRGEENTFRFTIPVKRFFGGGDAPSQIPAGSMYLHVFLKIPGNKSSLIAFVRGFAVNGQEYLQMDKEGAGFELHGQYELRHIKDDIYSVALSLGDAKKYLTLPRVPCDGGFDANPRCAAGVNTFEIRMGIGDFSGRVDASRIAPHFAILDTSGVTYPVILLHGHKSPSGMWGTVADVQGIAKYLEGANVLHVRQRGLGGGTRFTRAENRWFTMETNFGWDSDSKRETQADRLAALIEKVQKDFGVKRVNIIAYGKAGIDARMYLRKYKQTALDAIDTMVQVEPPNHGQGFPYVPDVSTVEEEIEDWEDMLKSVNSVAECDNEFYFSEVWWNDVDPERAKCRAYSNASAGRMEITPAAMRKFNYKEKKSGLVLHTWTFRPNYFDYEEAANIHVVVGGAWETWAEELEKKRSARNDAILSAMATTAQELFEFAASKKMGDILADFENKSWLSIIPTSDMHNLSGTGVSYLDVEKFILAKEGGVFVLDNPISQFAFAPVENCGLFNLAVGAYNLTTGNTIMGQDGTCKSPVSPVFSFSFVHSMVGTGLGVMFPHVAASLKTGQLIWDITKSWGKAATATMEAHKTAAKSNAFGVSHQSATLPWAVKCSSKFDVGSECTKEELVVTDFGEMNAHTTWPEEWAIKVDRVMEGASDNILLAADSEYREMEWALNGVLDDERWNFKAAKGILKDAASDAENNHPGWGHNEPVYQNFFGSKAGAGGHSFVLQAGVPVVVTVYVLGEPNATAVVKSPSGVETPITNASTESFLGQLALTPDESGTWSVLVNGTSSDMYVVRVGRERTPTIAMGALVSDELLAPGGETELVGWLYDPSQSKSVDFAQLPQTAQGSYSTLAMQAVVQNPDGSLETVPMSDAGDGFYKGTFRPSAKDGKLLVRVLSLRDGEIQLMNEEPLEITVTQAAASEILTLSAPTDTKDAEGYIEQVQYTVTANLAQAGEYVMAAAIGVQKGECDSEGCTHMTNLRSSRVTASAPGEYAFTIELDRDFVARHKDDMPFNFNTADLFFVNHGSEELMTSKVFNQPIPYEDINAFLKPAIEFLGVQGQPVLRDTDGDGKPDQAAITYRVKTPTDGHYTLHAALSGGDAGIFGSGEFQRSAGEFDVEITFNNICRFKDVEGGEFTLQGVEAYGPVTGTERARYPITLDLSEVGECTSNLPDLQVAGGSSDSLQFTKARVVSGGVAISNTGSQGAETVVWTARLGSSTGKLLDAGVIDSLAAGASEAIAIAAHEEDVGDGAQVCVVVNPGHDITEHDYSNNERCFTVKAGGTLDPVDPVDPVGPVDPADPVDPVPGGAFTITVSADPAEGGSVTCSEVAGGTATCTATPGDGYMFIGLTLASGTAGITCDGTTCTLSNITSNVSVRASFALRGSGALPVPTLGEVGLLLSGIALAGAAAPALRRRREQQERKRA